MSIERRGRQVLAGDIGGTKTHLARYFQGKTRPVARDMASYASRDAADLETLVARFLEKNPGPVDNACFAIAGPVIDGLCRTTNLPWQVSESHLTQRFGWHVRLVNDLAATALGIALLHSRELFALNTARPQKGKNIAIIAPGTGLGTSILSCHGGKYIPIASEGGHADFAPIDETHVLLWREMAQRYGHVSIERIVSGVGLLNIFFFLKNKERYRVPAWLVRNIENGDPARAIAEAALQEKEPLCIETLGMFTAALGSIAGNLALTVLATGGVYLGGGIAPKILPALTDGVFMSAFTNKGRFKALLEKIPVRVILNDKAAIIGAAHCALTKSLGDLTP
ncbi:MAG: glucokinase [Deltaproteobacteria bacterium]|nr:glucokinase [Deltaproteobacteria bacterium]